MDKFNILTINGGGSRGIIPAVILHKIEEELNKPLCESFDLIVGTSTGGIIASALAKGISTKDIVKLYQTEVKTIFSRSGFYKIKSLDGNILPKYPNTGLINTIKKYLGDDSVLNTKVDFMVTAYNTLTDDITLLKSWKEQYQNLSFSDFAIMTASAPTYFPNYKFNVDGGIYANNPVMLAWLEALKKGYSFDNINIVSVGTGDVVRSHNTENWGAKHWIITGDDKPIISKMIKGQNKVANYATNLLFKNYVDLDFEIDRSLKDMDAPENVSTLFDLTVRNIIDSNRYKKAIEIINK